MDLWADERVSKSSLATRWTLMRVSVVVPLYNHARDLPLCLNALLSQSEQPAEIIIVDDASTDNGAAVARQFADQHACIELLTHPTNSGAPAALNTGLERASGDLVLFAGADDVVLPGIIKTATEQFRLHPQAGLCCGEISLIDDCDNVIGFRPPILPTFATRYLPPEQVRKIVKSSDNWLCGPTITYHRERLLEIGGFTEELGSFCDGFAARLLSFRHGFIFVPEILAAWRIVTTSLSHSMADDKDRELKLLDNARRHFELHSETVPPSYPQRFEDRYRFGIGRLRIIHQQHNRISKVIRLARLFVRYRPMNALQLLTGLLRHRVLSGNRKAAVETFFQAISAQK